MGCEGLALFQTYLSTTHGDFELALNHHLRRRGSRVGRYSGSRKNHSQKAKLKRHHEAGRKTQKKTSSGASEASDQSTYVWTIRVFRVSRTGREAGTGFISTRQDQIKPEAETEQV